MRIWLKLDGDLILDAIEYEKEGFTSFEVNKEDIPHGVYYGFYRFVDNQFVFDQAIYNSYQSESNDA